MLASDGDRIHVVASADENRPSAGKQKDVADRQTSGTWGSRFQVTEKVASSRRTIVGEGKEKTARAEADSLLSESRLGPLIRFIDANRRGRSGIRGAHRTTRHASGYPRASLRGGGHRCPLRRCDHDRDRHNHDGDGRR